MAKVKKSNNNDNFLSFIKSVYTTKVFSNKINMKNLYIYLAISFVLLLIITAAKIAIAGDNTFLESILYILIGIPFIFFIFYGIFYIFLNALESKRKPFVESFLVFSTIAIPFLIIGNLITLFSALTFNSTIIGILSSLTIVNILYLIANLIINFKNYYNTSSFRIITSLILVEVFIGIFAVLQYLALILAKV